MLWGVIEIHTRDIQIVTKEMAASIFQIYPTDVSLGICSVQCSVLGVRRGGIKAEDLYLALTCTQTTMEELCPYQSLGCLWNIGQAPGSAPGHWLSSLPGIPIFYPLTSLWSSILSSQWGFPWSPCLRQNSLGLVLPTPLPCSLVFPSDKYLFHVCMFSVIPSSSCLFIVNPLIFFTALFSVSRTLPQ